MKHRLRAASGRPALVLLVALTVAVPVAHAATPVTKQVELKDIAFGPKAVTIKSGQRVKWTWNDPFTSHNIHSRKGSKRFPGASSRQKGTYTVTFKTKGTYRYECTIHPGMYGSVVVK